MNKDEHRFRGKVTAITGGAKGIGRACALRFAREGARVAVLDILPKEAQATACQVEDLGQEALAIHCDVRDKDHLAAAVAQIMDAWGRIDVWVNNAGVYSGSPVPEVSQEDWNRTLGTNFTGTFLGCGAVAPIMRRQRSGRIINISSMAGKTSWPATAEYSASKSAIIGMTRTVALDLAPFGITVNAICPGNTETDMVRQVAGAAGAREGVSADEWLQQRASDCPLGRLAAPEEIAGPVAFLASEDARYITGQAISVDGGMVF